MVAICIRIWWLNPKATHALCWWKCTSPPLFKSKESIIVQWLVSRPKGGQRCSSCTRRRRMKGDIWPNPNFASFCPLAPRQGQCEVRIKCPAVLLCLHSRELTEEKTFRGINASAERGKSSVNNTQPAEGHKLLFFPSIPGKSDLQDTIHISWFIQYFGNGLNNAIWCGYHNVIRVLVIMPAHH